MEQTLACKQWLQPHQELIHIPSEAAMLVVRIRVIAGTDQIEIVPVDTATVAVDDILDLMFIPQAGKPRVHVPKRSPRDIRSTGLSSGPDRTQHPTQ